MTARNAPCPCGSGQKYKRCHGRPGAAEASGKQARNAQQQLEQARQSLQGGQVELALEQARQLPPGLPRTELLSGILLAQRNTRDAPRLTGMLREWLQQDPAAPEPAYRMAQVEWLREDLEAARRAVAEAVKRAPEAAMTLYYRAIDAQLHGDVPKALKWYEKAMTASSRVPLSGTELRLEAAIQAFETAAGQYPGAPYQDEAGLVNREHEQSALRDALQEWTSEWRRDPSPMPSDLRARFANAWYNLGCTTMADFGRVDEGIDAFRNASDVDPEHMLARLNHCFMLNYSDRHDADDVASAHRECGQWMAGRAVPYPLAPPAALAGSRKLRVGYLSSDFRSHSVAHFIVPVLEAHDAERLDVYAYYNDAREDAYTRRVRRAVRGFHVVAGWDDDALQRQIAEDGIDILVDLNGLTRGHRMALLARRAAPVQASWIGYPNTTGLPAMDYRIVDAVTDPPGSGRPWHVEHLVRLEPGFSVYEPHHPLPGLAQQAPFETNGYVTLGSFNHLPKLSPTLLTAWGRILGEVPTARLLVKAIALDQPSSRQRLANALESVGVAPERFDLVGRIAEKTGHLAYFQNADLSLDSFPYNGTTTTCDSLVMGVPVLTLAGDDHRSRVSASQLSAVGLDELVADSVDDYVQRAIRLAQNPQQLSALRDGLRDRMLRSPLMDARKLCRQLEQAYHDMWDAQTSTPRQ